MSRDGRNVYVEPAAYAWSGGELLVVGRPTILWRKLGPFTADSVLGVVVESDGTLRLVESPLDLRLVGMLRAIGRRGGGWDLILAERPSPTAGDSVARLWHGVYDGRRWRSLTQLPNAPGMQPLAFGASNLDRAGDTLSWAVRVRNPADYTTSVQLLRLRGGRWSSELVPTRRAVYLALKHLTRAGLQLAVVAPDLTETRDDNSLFLWTEHPSWNVRRRVSFGARDGPAHYPTLVDSERPILTWYVDTERAREVRALADPLSGSLARVVTIDSSFADRGAPGSVRLRGGHHLWVSHHIAGTNTRSLRFVVSNPPAPATTQTFASPYRTSIRALGTGDSKFVVIGAQQDTASGGFHTSLIRARMVCTR